MAKFIILVLVALLVALIYIPVSASGVAAQAQPNSPVTVASDLAQVKDLLQTSLLNVVLLGAAWFLWRAYQAKADALADLQQKHIDWLQTVWLQQQRPGGVVPKFPEVAEVAGLR